MSLYRLNCFPCSQAQHTPYSSARLAVLYILLFSISLFSRSCSKPATERGVGAGGKWDKAHTPARHRAALHPCTQYALTRSRTHRSMHAPTATSAAWATHPGVVVHRLVNRKSKTLPHLPNLPNPFSIQRLFSHATRCATLSGCVGRPVTMPGSKGFSF